jgi:Domain of unknown function (DUF5668)
MSNRIRCTCLRCTIRGLMGPAILITVGVLFLLDQMRGSYFSFSNTFPVILIVIGAISLASAFAPMDGHLAATGSAAAPVVPGSTPGAPQSPLPGPGQGQ